MTTTARRANECRGDLLAQSRRGRADGRGPAGAGRPPGGVRVVPARRATCWPTSITSTSSTSATARASGRWSMRRARRSVPARAAGRARSSGCVAAAAAAALLVCGGSASAAVWWWRRPRRRRAARVRSSPAAGAPSAGACAAPAHARARRHAVEAGAARAPAAGAAPRRAAVAAGERRRRPRPSVLAEAGARAGRATARSRGHAVSPVAARVPGTPEALVVDGAARPPAARRRLGARRAGAVRRLPARRAARGPLVAEALYGKGRALESLGDGDEERRDLGTPGHRSRRQRLRAARAPAPRRAQVTRRLARSRAALALCAALGTRLRARHGRAGFRRRRPST